MRENILQKKEKILNFPKYGFGEEQEGILFSICLRKSGLKNLFYLTRQK